MSTINFPDHLPKHIVEHITSIRNYLKKRNLKSIQIEDDQLTITDLGEVAVYYNPDGCVEADIDTDDNDNNVDNNINSSEIILPIYNDSQLKAARSVLTTAKKIIDVMLDEDLIELIHHPVLDINDDIRHEIEEMYNLCSSGGGNEHRFTAGYYVLLNEGGDRWTRNISNFQRGCKKYYELIRLIVVNITGVECGEEWKRHIKKNIFYVNIKPTYLKDINRKNWPVIQQTVINYCHYYLQPQQRQQLQRQRQQRLQIFNLFLRWRSYNRYS
jgi:hypothetical protein